jgi:predicted KAP-like P-loop ATPase
VKSVLAGLFEAADTLLRAEPERLGFLDFGIKMPIVGILFQLLDRLEENQRVLVLNELVNSGESLATIVYGIVILGQMHGKYGTPESTSERDQLISAEAQEMLEKLAAKRISQDAHSGALLVTPELARVLSNWQDWQDSGECDIWISEVRDEPKFLVALITSTLSVGHSQAMGFAGLGDRVARRTYRVSLKFLRRVIDPDAVRPIVKFLLSQKELSERERLALETFSNARDDDENEA